MAFGLTENGFIPKRLADIKREIENDLKAGLGNSINLLPSSVLGQIVGIVSDREKDLWELGEGIYNSQYPAVAEGITLDNVASLTGVTRLPGTRSSVVLLFKGDAGTIIPANTIFSVANNATARFVLAADLTLVAGVDEVQTLTFGAVPDAGSFRLSLNGEETALLTFQSSAADVENALNALSSLSSASVAGDFLSGFVITFTGEDGKEDKPLLEVVSNTLTESSNAVATTLVETTKGVPSGQATLEAEEIGETSAPARALTVIDNPQTGLDFVVNIEDATLGNEVETDAELKARREESLQRAGAGTLGSILSVVSEIEGVTAQVGFENVNLIEVDGRPPKSFEIVVQGGDEDIIAQTIFNTKPAGIETFGSVTRQITDSQGFLQSVKFSRPTGIPIFVELDLSTDANYPADGDDQVKAAIVAFGNALGIGADVIVIPKLLCSIDSIPGITDAEIRVGIAANPTDSNNIAIDPAQISQWDTSRVAVGSL